MKAAQIVVNVFSSLELRGNLLAGAGIFAAFAQLASIGYWVSIVLEQWQTCLYFIPNIGAIVSVSVSLSAISAITVDRLLALLTVKAPIQISFNP